MSGYDFTPTSETNQPIITDLKDFSTFPELRASPAYQKHEHALQDLFNTPRIYRAPNPQPRLRSFLRVVVWNIERGARLEGIIEALTFHPVLQYADLLLFNELDDGMIRSRNLNVALELSRALSAHAIFGVEYLEFTNGTGAERQLTGDNTAALHGNAILTRHNFSLPEIVRLPRCENNFESAEKRIGGRFGLLVNIELGDKTLLATTAHLDVVNTPRCRAKQLRGLLEAIDGRQQSATDTPYAILLGGDFNTHTFARGGRFRAMQNTIRILGSNRQALARRLLRKEPVIRQLERQGYDVDALNDGLPTSSSLVSGLDDKSSWPPPMRWWVKRRIGPGGIRLEFRLDWLAARGVRVLQAGEVRDEVAGVLSINPQTIKNLTDGGRSLSDHDPIVADVTLGD